MDNHFIIIGTAKSGSSTLYEYLKAHPKTKLANTKEHNFFMNIGYNWKSSNYKIFKRKLIFTLGAHNKFVKNKIINRYKEICKNDKIHISGDGSINYFYFKEVPKRIKTFAPKAKLILILRNPIDRLYSNYWMNYKQAEKDANWQWPWNSFEDFIENGGHTHAINQYTTNLKRWLRYFSLEEILIIDSSNLFKNTNQVLQEVTSFLGVASIHYTENIWIK
ncbi:sulfotransferase domain-containing protein [Lacinutrix gracilariae]|uniref:Sulfotransferase domain-containing protein n=1 Tax=Lacinutrix gracilariae TaxID=1747198 RepID=A0ABW5K2A2_9FLAO